MNSQAPKLFTLTGPDGISEFINQVDCIGRFAGSIKKFNDLLIHHNHYVADLINKAIEEVRNNLLHLNSIEQISYLDRLIDKATENILWLKEAIGGSSTANETFIITSGDGEIYKYISGPGGLDRYYKSSLFYSSIFSGYLKTERGRILNNLNSYHIELSAAALAWFAWILKDGDRPIIPMTTGSNNYINNICITFHIKFKKAARNKFNYAIIELVNANSSIVSEIQNKLAPFVEESIRTVINKKIAAK